MKRLTVAALALAALAVILPLSAGASAPVVVDAGGEADDGAADAFLVNVNGADLEVRVNGVLVVSTPIAGVSSVAVQGSGDDDTLTVESGGGLVAVPGGIHFDGGDGSDTLSLTKTGGPTVTSSVVTAGPGPGDGTSVMTDGTNTQRVAYENLEPVLDTVAAANLTVNGTPANNAINYTAGGAGNGLVSVDDFETYEFSNKTNLTINGLAGSDAINLNYPGVTNPTGLTGVITVAGGDPTGSDSLIANGVAGVLDNLRTLPTNTGAGTVVNDSEPQPNVNYGGIEHLQLAVQEADGDAVRLDGTTGNDAFTFVTGGTQEAGTLGGTMDTNNATGNGPFPMTPTTYSGVHPLANDVDVNFFNPGGTDTLRFDGTADADTIQYSGGEAGGGDIRDTVNGQLVSRLETFNLSSAVIRGLGGDDVFGRSPGGPLATAVTFQGGPGVADVLNYTANPSAPTTIDLAAGTIASTGIGLTNFASIEHLGEASSGSATLTVNATGGGDSLDYTPTGATAGTIKRAGSPIVTFTGVTGVFTLDAAGGTDSVTVNGTAGSDAVSVTGVATATDVAIAGLKAVRLPTANTESLSVEPGSGDDSFSVDGSTSPVAIPTVLAGGAGANTAAVTGNGAGAMNVTLGATTRIVQAGITRLDVLAVDSIDAGTGGGDLVVLGTAADDQFGYQPMGAQTGLVTLNGALPQLALDTGGGALTIDPRGGTNVVRVSGTAAADTFDTQANPTATVQVGGLLPLSIPSANVDLLVLRGLNGQDTFDVTTFTTASLHLLVEGGIPSGDKLTLFTTAKPVKKSKKASKGAGFIAVEYPGLSAVWADFTGVESAKTKKL